MPYCKRLIFTCFGLLLYAIVFSQSSPAVDMTGLWTGLMYNDSTNLNYRYEIAISEKNGKLTGYSQTFFIIDGKEFYGLKKIRISIDGNKVITQDLKLVENNYPSTVKIPKGVYVINALNFERKDDVMILSGLFETNRTRYYRPVTGYIHVERKAEFKESPLVKQLKVLGLDNELSFIPQELTTKDVAVIKTEPVKEQPIAKTKPVKEKTVKEKPAKEKEVAEKETPTQKATVQNKPAADINNRVIETIQSVNYKSDSLVLALYDNGEVDGDTVSVLMNGEVIMPSVGLSTNAVRKTIYTKDIKDSIRIVMYAETLGSLPPNTGLLIVYDGTDRYEIRFSGDLKKNAAIVFRRKEN